MTDDLAAFHEAAWDLLAEGPEHPDAPARLLCLASTGLDGTPQARMVVLRAVDRAARVLRVHSDSAAAKCAELHRTPMATLLVWDPSQSLQLRLSTHCSQRRGTAQEWAALSEPAQRLYGATPPPGAPLPTPASHDPTPSAARFAVLEFKVVRLDLLHLGRSRHRRARFARENGWHGQWIAP